MYTDGSVAGLGFDCQARCDYRDHVRGQCSLRGLNLQFDSGGGRSHPCPLLDCRSRGDNQTTHAIIHTDPMSLLQKVKSQWKEKPRLECQCQSVVDIHLWKPARKFNQLLQFWWYWSALNMAESQAQFLNESHWINFDSINKTDEIAGLFFFFFFFFFFLFFQFGSFLVKGRSWQKFTRSIADHLLTQWKNHEL